MCSMTSELYTMIPWGCIVWIIFIYLLFYYLCYIQLLVNDSLEGKCLKHLGGILNCQELPFSNPRTDGSHHSVAMKVTV